MRRGKSENAMTQEGKRSRVARPKNAMTQEGKRPRAARPKNIMNTRPPQADFWGVLHIFYGEKTFQSVLQEGVFVVKRVQNHIFLPRLRGGTL